MFWRSQLAVFHGLRRLARWRGQLPTPGEVGAFSEYFHGLDSIGRGGLPLLDHFG